MTDLIIQTAATADAVAGKQYNADVIEFAARRHLMLEQSHTAFLGHTQPPQHAFRSRLTCNKTASGMHPLKAVGIRMTKSAFNYFVRHQSEYLDNK
jgi:hypothetical protein